MGQLRPEKSFPEFVQVKIHEIVNHPAWYDDITGTEAEILLRNKKDLTFLLRQGEKTDHFYLSFVKDECYFTHIPFTVKHDTKEWFYMNCIWHSAATLKEFVPDIMHAAESDITPLAPLSRM